MRYWLLILLVLVAGLIAVAGYALVQSLQTPQQTMGKAVQQTAERILVLNISVDSAEFPPGSAIHLKATVMNAGTEEVLLE
jgi:Flp pilus assembly protein CpaB